MGDTARPYAVVYDGACAVCGRIIAVLKKWDRDRSVEVVPSQTAGIEARFPWISPDAFAESLQLVRIADGKTWERAAAVEELLRVLPRARPISWLFRVPFARSLADRAYRAFARNRYRLGCDEHCRAQSARSGPDPTPNSGE